MMFRAELSDLACDIAFVTFCMTDALAAYDEAALPGGYRYDLFGGFMGFCDHTGQAGLALVRAARRYDGEHWTDWIEIVDHYAQSAVARAVETGRPLPDAALADLARASLRLFESAPT